MNQTAIIRAATSEHGWWQKLFGLGQDATKDTKEVEMENLKSEISDKRVSTGAEESNDTEVAVAPDTIAAVLMPNGTSNETSFNETVQGIVIPKSDYNNQAINNMAEQALETSEVVDSLAEANATADNVTVVSSGVEESKDAQEIVDNVTDVSSGSQ